MGSSVLSRFFLWVSSCQKPRAAHLKALVPRAPHVRSKKDRKEGSGDDPVRSDCSGISTIAVWCASMPRLRLEFQALLDAKRHSHESESFRGLAAAVRQRGRA